jgi:hypothetical protein
MYYSNRVDLGRMLGGRLTDLKGVEPVVIALKESALTACIGLASTINGWIFPLLSKTIEIPGDPRIMGAIGPNGNFTWSPDLEKIEIDSIEMESHMVIEDAKRQAFSELNQLLGKYGNFSKDALNGRILLLTGDVIRDRMEIAVALEYLKSVRYANLYGLGGNVESDVATFYHINTDVSVVLDVMSHMFSAEHYFERQEDYSVEECRLLVTNISQYWT